MSAGGRSRAAALALLIGIVAIFVAALIVPAALYWSKTGTVIQDARSKTQNAMQRAEATRTLQTTRAAWDDFVTSPRSGFVLADTDQAGIAQTTKRITSLFTQYGGTLTSVSGEGVESSRAGVSELKVSASGVIPRDNIGPFLTALESDPAYLVLSEFKAAIRGQENLRLTFVGSVYRLMEPEV